MIANQQARLRRVESRQNSLIKQLRRAFSRGEEVEGCFAVEGIKLIEEAIRSGSRFKAVVFSDSGAQRAQRLLPQLRSNIETLVVDDEIFASAVESESPQGVAALVQVKEHPLEAALPRGGGFCAVAAGIQDPGNLGTLLRSAEAFGGSSAIFTVGTVSRFNPKVSRASAGSIFRLPIVGAKMEELIPELKKRGVRLIGTTSHQATPLPEAELAGEIAFVIGNEGAGLPKALLAKMDLLVTIPHSEKVESLNAGVAASLLFYEAARQRAVKP
jgi:TrmH family RNA methyltransferase